MKLLKYKNVKDDKVRLLMMATLFDMTLYSNDENLHSFVKKLSENATIRKIDFYITLKLVIENLLQNKNGISLNLNTNFYSKMPKRYNKFNINSRKLYSVLDFLKEQDYIEIYKGFSSKISYLTRVIPTKKLFNDLKNVDLLSISNDKNMERIILKDQKKKYIDYKENRNTKYFRKFILDYEKFLNSQEIVFNKKKYNIFYKRIFNNDVFNLGGRFYSRYQNLKQNERQNCLINGDDVVELDYSGLHINMLYAKENLKFEGDVYTIKGYEKYRDIFKVLLQIVLNAKNRKSAYSGMNKHLIGNGMKGEAKKLFSEFEKKHEPIKKYFFSGIGLKLQYEDSQMVFDILKIALKRKIPVLPIHDSFITPRKHKDFLYKLMNEVYYKKYKMEIKVSQK